MPLALGVAFATGASVAANAACQLQSPGGDVKRVVNIVFDNVHLRRDNPNVPSDLEQMPNLLSFILSNGTISGNHHTPLISHTATDILTAQTGVYGSRMGIPVSNAYGFFRPDGSVGFGSSFVYWTVVAGDGKPQMLNDNGKTVLAPWAPFTRAGCDVGGFAVARLSSSTFRLTSIRHLARVTGGSGQAWRRIRQGQGGFARYRHPLRAGQPALQRRRRQARRLAG